MDTQLSNFDRDMREPKSENPTTQATSGALAEIERALEDLKIPTTRSLWTTSLRPSTKIRRDCRLREWLDHLPRGTRLKVAGGRAWFCLDEYRATIRGTYCFYVHVHGRGRLATIATYRRVTGAPECNVNSGHALAGRVLASTPTTSTARNASMMS